MIWILILLLVSVVSCAVWTVHEILDRRRHREALGFFEDPDAEPIDNRPTTGPFWWYYRLFF